MSLEYSVGIPVRNEENTLEDCINSFLNQSIPPKEVLVCVSNSEDNSYDIASQLSKLDERIKPLTSRLGKPAAWNKIVENSKTNLIHFTDGDVIADKKASESLLSSFNESPNLAIVSGTTIYVTPKNETFFSKLNNRDYEKILEVDTVCGRNYMINRNETFSIGQRLKIDIMDESIINDDLFLNLLAGSEQGRLEFNYDSYCFSQPISSLSEWYKVSKRILDGQRQLNEIYPFLENNTREATRTFSDLVGRFNEVSFKEKLSKTFFYSLRKIMIMDLKLKNNDFNNLWEVDKSSKQPFKQYKI